MSGHSKWSQIKRKKGIKDAQKGNVFAKISRQVTIAVIEGGGITDPDKNVKLRMAIEHAKKENMPKENVQRAIEKGVGPEKEKLQEVIYEAFGPGGIAFLIQATTDNSNRTISEIKSSLDKHGGKIGNQGSVSYLFTRCGLVAFEKEKNKEDEIFNFADKVSALDIEEDNSSVMVYLPFENLGKVQSELKGLESTSVEIDYKPSSIIKIEDRVRAKKIIGLVEALESLDDVTKVYSNFDIPEEIMTQQVS